MCKCVCKCVCVCLCTCTCVCVHVQLSRGGGACRAFVVFCVLLITSKPIGVVYKSRKICRVGQNHIYTVYIRYFLQGFYRIYGHIRCIYTVLANPKHMFLTLTSVYAFLLHVYVDVQCKYATFMGAKEYTK